MWVRMHATATEGLEASRYLDTVGRKGSLWTVIAAEFCGTIPGEVAK